MSVIVKGMKFPAECRECPFEHYYISNGETICRATNATLASDYNPIRFDGRYPDCPLVEIPDKHGRLIETDKLEADCEYDFYYEGFSGVSIEQIRNAPTILEAEGQEE